jgi:hypothetical protein
LLGALLGAIVIEKQQSNFAVRTIKEKDEINVVEAD